MSEETKINVDYIQMVWYLLLWIFIKLYAIAVRILSPSSKNTSHNLKVRGNGVWNKITRHVTNEKRFGVEVGYAWLRRLVKTKIIKPVSYSVNSFLQSENSTWNMLDRFLLFCAELFTSHVADSLLSLSAKSSARWHKLALNTALHAWLQNLLIVQVSTLVE